jgi:hypothetical protein
MTRAHASLQSEELARSVSSGVHKCIAFGQEAAKEAAQFIREKVEQEKSQSKHKG